MYLSATINDAFDINKEKFVGNLTYKTIQRRLGMIFDHPKDLKFKVETFEDIDEDEFTVSGLYDMVYDKKYVILNFSNQSDSINIDNYTFDQFKFLVSQTIQHEAIHQSQYEQREEIEEPVKLDFRNFAGTLDEEREYLSDLDEIDAYAHDIAMEIKYFYPNKNPYDILKTIGKRRKIVSYNYYKKTFKGCGWTAIKNKLLLKTYNWMPYA